MPVRVCEYMQWTKRFVHIKKILFSSCMYCDGLLEWFIFTVMCLY